MHTETRVQAELEASLRDPRLLNLIARRLFEQRLVDHLAQSSDSDRKALLAAAIRTFGWVRDRARLEQFGASGRKLNHEIDSTSLIALQEKAGFWAPARQAWRFRRARRKRARARITSKKQWLWWTALILMYTLIAIFNNLNR